MFLFSKKKKDYRSLLSFFWFTGRGIQKIGIDQVVNMQQLENEYSFIRKERRDQIKRIEANSIESIGIDPKKSDVEDSKIEVSEECQWFCCND